MRIRRLALEVVEVGLLAAMGVVELAPYWCERLRPLWRNWTVHNLIAHPVSEAVYLVTRDEALAGRIHDATIPAHETGTGRG